MKQNKPLSLLRRIEDLTNILYLLVGLPLVLFVWVYLNLRTIQPWGYFADPAYRAFLNGGLLLLALGLAVLAFLQYRKRFDGLEPETVQDAKPAGTIQYEADEERTIDQDSAAQAVKQQVNHKFELFKAAALQKYFLLTGSTLLVILGFYLSAVEFYAALYGLLLIIFSMNRPTPDLFFRDMRLTKVEREAVMAEIMQERRQEQSEGKK